MKNEAALNFERRFPNRMDDLNTVTTEALQFIEASNIDPQAAYLVNFAIEEMTTNILKYGYSDNAAHQIDLQIVVEPHSVRLVLVDDGHRFNPLESPEPDVDQPAEDRMPGGLGIFLVRKMIPDIRYERIDERNCLTLQIPRQTA